MTLDDINHQLMMFSDECEESGFRDITFALRLIASPKLLKQLAELKEKQQTVTDITLKEQEVVSE